MVGHLPPWSGSDGTMWLRAATKVGGHVAGCELARRPHPLRSCGRGGGSWQPCRMDFLQQVYAAQARAPRTCRSPSAARCCARGLSIERRNRSCKRRELYMHSDRRFSGCEGTVALVSRALQEGPELWGRVDPSHEFVKVEE